ncbi:MAG: hypothetical protein PHY48_07455 [Candidatus Cloacimonetes bacterium]|nr:hypothetical protein [Candidatus Cloacimonadota bacterium]
MNDTGEASFDPVDFSGVSVALYHLAVLDTTIARINLEYPQIGVQISQETEFDHRLQDPVQVVMTDPEGNFSFAKITPGAYNLAILKEGWGFRYLYNMQISEGSNQLSASVVKQDIEADSSPSGQGSARAELILYPERVMPAALNAEYVFLPFRVYRWTQNSLIMGDVTLNTGAQLLIEGNSRLELYGQITCIGSIGYWKVTTADNIYSTQKVESITRYDNFGVKSLHAPSQITNMICDYSNNGVSVENQTLNISNSIIRNTLSTSLTLRNSSTDLNRLLLYNSGYRGITSYSTANMSYSLLVNNKEGLMMHEAIGNISNSYFYGSERAVRTFMQPSTFENNCFDRNSTALAPCASSPIIRYNNFYDNGRDVEMNRYGQFGIYQYCNPVIEYNNHWGNKYYYHLVGSSSLQGDGYIPTPGVISDQTYPYNYFLASSLTYRIYDGNNPNANISWIVYTPYRRTIPEQNAGIN